MASHGFLHLRKVTRQRMDTEKNCMIEDVLIYTLDSSLLWILLFAQFPYSRACVDPSLLGISRAFRAAEGRRQSGMFTKMRTCATAVNPVWRVCAHVRPLWDLRTRSISIRCGNHCPLHCSSLPFWKHRPCAVVMECHAPARKIFCKYRRFNQGGGPFFFSSMS